MKTQSRIPEFVPDYLIRYVENTYLNGRTFHELETGLNKLSIRASVYTVLFAVSAVIFLASVSIIGSLICLTLDVTWTEFMGIAFPLLVSVAAYMKERDAYLKLRSETELVDNLVKLYHDADNYFPVEGMPVQTFDQRFMERASKYYGPEALVLSVKVRGAFPKPSKTTGSDVQKEEFEPQTNWLLRNFGRNFSRRRRLGEGIRPPGL